MPLRLKILGTALKPSPTASTQPATKPGRDGSIVLEPSEAELHGSQIRVEQRQGHEYIAAWDKPEDWISWKIAFPAAATYQVDLVCTAAYADTGLAIELADQKLEATAKKTSGWFDYRTLNLGTLHVSAKGPADLAVREETGPVAGTEYSGNPPRAGQSIRHCRLSLREKRRSFRGELVK